MKKFEPLKADEKSWHKKSPRTKEKLPIRPMTETEVKNFQRRLDKLHSDFERVKGKWYDYWIPVPNHSVKERKAKDIYGVVIHTTEGWGTPYKTFSNPERQASAHYSVERDGSIVYMVDEKDIAWHAGGVNKWTVGIEVSGFSVHNGKSAVISNGAIGLTQRQMESLAKLTASICKRNGIYPSRQTIFGHRHSGGCGANADSRPDVPQYKKVDGKSVFTHLKPNLKGTAGGRSCHHDPGNDFDWDNFLGMVRWYYYRPYVFGAFGGLSALTIALVAIHKIREKNKRRK